LKPYTTYYYQFNVCNSSNKSPVGRTKTTPHADDDITKVSLAVYSCSNYPFGFFNAFGNPVRKVCLVTLRFGVSKLTQKQDSVDYVIHLGDYIYEYKNGDYGWGNSIGRIPLPDKEIYSLYDYRKRLATYRTDLDLVASHQAFPWM
jgi:alkaline phosphatase D